MLSQIVIMINKHDLKNVALKIEKLADHLPTHIVYIILYLRDSKLFCKLCHRMQEGIDIRQDLLLYQ